MSYENERQELEHLYQLAQAVFGPVRGQSPLTDQALIKRYYR